MKLQTEQYGFIITFKIIKKSAMVVIKIKFTFLSIYKGKQQ